MEGLIHQQFEFCPCNGWEGFKQRTDTIKPVIFKDFSAKKGLGNQEADQSKFYCLKPEEVMIVWQGGEES